MLKKLASALSAALLIAAPAMAQYVNYPIAPINTPITTPQDAANSALSKVNAYLQANPVSGLPANNPTFTGTLTGPTTNLTGSNPFSFGGSIYSVLGPTNTNATQALFFGLGAGANYPTSGSDALPAVGFGANSLTSLTALNTEDTALGVGSARYLTTGTLVTAVGFSADAVNTTSVGDTAVGTDSLRDAVSTGYSTGVGEAALAHGNPQGVNAFGLQALAGNSSAILITGSVTAGNTLTIGITNGGSFSLSNLPYSSVYTVQTGDTLGSNSSTGIAYKICNGGTGLSGTALANSNITPSSGATGFKLSCVAYTTPEGYGVISLTFPGTSSTGWALSTTATPTGTLSASVTNGSNPQNSGAFGSMALRGYAMAPGANYNYAFGDNALQNLRSNSFNASFGYGNLNSVTTTGGNYAFGYFAGNLFKGTGGIFMGYSPCPNAASNDYLVCIGYNAGTNVTSGSGFNLLIGPGAANSTLTTGSNDLILSAQSGVDTPAGGTSNYVNIDKVYENYAVISGISVVSGGGTSPTIAGTGTAFFQVTEGTGSPSATLVLGMPAAANDWFCSAVDVKTAPIVGTQNNTGTSTTSVSILFSSAPAAGDIIKVQCAAR